MAESLSVAVTSDQLWCLESTNDGGKSLQRVPVHSLPFRIGRLDGLDLTIPYKSISKRHAEIFVDDDGLKVRDLASTNGTFVNRKRVSGAQLGEGDILHFAEFEFRLGLQPRAVIQAEAWDERRGTLALSRLDLPRQFEQGTKEFGELLHQERTSAVFQPIVTLPDGEPAAYEVLGRGTHPELPASPQELFRIAATMGMESDLSRLFRKRAVQLLAASKRRLPLLFLNTHPAELDGPELVPSLSELRDLAPDQEFALEIHESALAEPDSLAALQTHLDELDIRIAYDDFGTGQARLLELAEVPPHFLKFDMRFVQHIDEAPPSKQRLLSALVAVARDLKAQTIAEGIERPEESRICTAVGFTLAQGYYYQKPMELEEI